jgi:cold-shock-like DNA binding protein
VHHTSIRGDEALQTGDKVTFSKVRGEQGIEATNVVRIEAVEPSTDTPKELRSRLL